MDTPSAVYCDECNSSSKGVHRYAWFDNALDVLMPNASSRFSRIAADAFGWLLENALFAVRLIHEESDIVADELPTRSALFVRAAQKRDMPLTAIRGPVGYTNNFLLRLNGKKHRFEGLPNVAWLNGRFAASADDKWATKKILRAHGFPVADGRPFWQWQLESAVRYGTKHLGFPLVVKPRNGSVARHVTINVRDEASLRTALHHAFAYSPAAIVERYIPGFVYRFTVVDDSFVACVQQLPAHIVGDGVHTIEELILQKNARPERHVHVGVKSFFHPIAVTEKTLAILSRQHLSATAIPVSGVRVWLADDPFMRNGGDLHEVTNAVHPDNRALAQDVAKLFGMKLVGIDFICEDATRSWKEQLCAILELNSLPSIEMHHSPSSGKPQDVAGAIAEMTLRYYR